MNDERAAEALDHLQAAALEMIQAARAFLDVAEEFVSDSEKVAQAVDALGAVADMARDAARSGHPRPQQGGAAGGPANFQQRVQHIRVS